METQPFLSFAFCRQSAHYFLLTTISTCVYVCVCVCVFMYVSLYCCYRLLGFAFLKNQLNFICLFTAALGLRCCVRPFSCGKWGPLCCSAQASYCCGFSYWALGKWASVAVVHGLSCPMACEIFLDKSLKPCPLHRRLILNHWTTREVQGCFCILTQKGKRM